MRKNPYRMLLVSLGISFAIMYAVMFLNVVSTGHLYLSITRIYMAVLMVAPMAVLMLGLRWSAFPNAKLNIGLITFAIMIFVGALAGLRTQTPIGDVQFMKAMIPHHSSAILTSENATFTDPEVQRLADDIIEAQKREIEMMEEMIERLER